MSREKERLFQVRSHEWGIIQLASEEALCSPAEYINDALLITLVAAEILLKNRSDGKDSTCLLFEQPDGTYLADDLEAEFTRETPSVQLDNLPEEPFNNEGQVLLPIDPSTLTCIDGASALLEVEVHKFICVALDLRRKLWFAQLENRDVQLETSTPGTYYDMLPVID